jgi:hypothetical protein
MQTFVSYTKRSRCGSFALISQRRLQVQICTVPDVECGCCHHLQAQQQLKYVLLCDSLILFSHAGHNCIVTTQVTHAAYNCVLTG